MHQLPVGGNFPGLIFAVGSALIFLIAIPALWYVMLGALVIGLLTAAAFQVGHNKQDRMSHPRILAPTRVRWHREL